jgi:hypothetical protein
MPHLAKMKPRWTASGKASYVFLIRMFTGLPMDTLWGQGKDAMNANTQCTNIDEQAESFITYLSSLSNKEALQAFGALSAHFWLRHVLSKNFCVPA